MGEIAGKPPVVRSRARVDPLHRIQRTLKQHYSIKRRRYGASWPDIYDRELFRIFSDEPRFARREKASVFLRSIRPRIRATVAEWTSAHSYTVDQVLQDMIERCRQLELRLALPRNQAKTQAVILLTVHTMNCLYAHRHEIPV